MLSVNRLLTGLVLLAFAVTLATARWTEETRAQAETFPVQLLPAALAEPIDFVRADTLHAGETLSDVLERAELETDDSRSLLAELMNYQDPRRVRPGLVFSFRRALEDGALRRVQLRLDADRTLEVRRSGTGWTGEITEVPVHVDTVVMTGVVESSLYGALLNGEAPGVPRPERERVVDLLADRIFAWEVDFSRDLRTGDRFRILYERTVRPDGTARSGRVLSVQFSINNREHEAYAFAPEGEGSEDYYNSKGESLRKAFLRAPLQYRRISSAFSRGRFHPILKVSRPHRGIDYAASSGTPVYAVGDGVIRRASSGGDYGNVVEIRHTRGYSTRYAHLRGFAKGIRSGVRVKQGEVIGYVGQSGLATGPHLHYEFHSNGRAVDPNSIRNIAGDPVPEAYLSKFMEVVQEQIALLDRSSREPLVAANEPFPAAVVGD